MENLKTTNAYVHKHALYFLPRRYLPLDVKYASAGTALKPVPSPGLPSSGPYSFSCSFILESALSHPYI